MSSPAGRHAPMVASTTRALTAGSGSENHNVPKPNKVQHNTSAWPRSESPKGRILKKKPSTKPASAPPGPVMNSPSIGPWLASGFRMMGPKNPAAPPTTPRASAQNPGDLRSCMAAMLRPAGAPRLLPASRFCSGQSDGGRTAPCATAVLPAHCNLRRPDGCRAPRAANRRPV